MGSYKLVIPQMTIHFMDKFPKRKKPVIAVSFEGENRLYKIASFNDGIAFNWFVECLEDALEREDVRQFPGRAE